jgi:hypothetical protein
MARADQPSDAQLLDRLRRSTQPRTAADLGVPASRLRKLAGVVQAGSVKTGKPGRPAILFTVEDSEAARSGAAQVGQEQGEVSEVA